MPRAAEKPRRYQVFRLTTEDRELLQELAKGRKYESRYEVLEALISHVEKISPAPKPPKKKALRLGIPTALDSALHRHAKKTRRTYIECLLLAARAFDKANPKEK